MESFQIHIFFKDGTQLFRQLYGTEKNAMETFHIEKDKRPFQKAFVLRLIGGLYRIICEISKTRNSSFGKKPNYIIIDEVSRMDKK